MSGMEDWRLRGTIGEDGMTIRPKYLHVYEYVVRAFDGVTLTSFEDAVPGTGLIRIRVAGRRNNEHFGSLTRAGIARYDELAGSRITEEKRQAEVRARIDQTIETIIQETSTQKGE